MPGLKPMCRQVGDEKQSCCICEENDCSIALSNRGDTILFADATEAITQGSRCDCIIALRRDNSIEIYAIELKNINETEPEKLGDVLEPSKLAEKWGNCLKWSLDIVNKFNSIKNKTFIRNYCILAISVKDKDQDSIQNTTTLIKRRQPSPKNILRGILPSIRDLEIRVIPCNESITGNVLIKL